MRQLNLGYGISALLDDEDYERCLTLHWLLKAHDATIYARAEITQETIVHGEVLMPPKNILMHRFILPPSFGRSHNAELTPLPLIDHINGKGYDNRKSNLRWASYRLNTLNTHPCEWHSVTRHPKVAGRWQYNAGDGPIGLFPTAFDAALAYDRTIRALGLDPNLCHFPPFEAPTYTRTHENLPCAP